MHNSEKKLPSFGWDLVLWVEIFLCSTQFYGILQFAPLQLPDFIYMGEVDGYMGGYALLDSNNKFYIYGHWFSIEASLLSALSIISVLTIIYTFYTKSMILIVH